MEKALTPARNGRLETRGQGIVSDATCSGTLSQSKFRFGFSKFNCFGIKPFLIASSTLISPATPAADSRCPIFALTEPSINGCSGSRSFPYTSDIACNSIASPMFEPTACASTKSTSEASTFARLSASSMTRRCAGPFGIINPPLAPFWLIADPRMTPQILSPFACASLKRFRTTIPQPSPRTNPSADSSKALHFPVGDNIPRSTILLVHFSDSMAFTPPARAKSVSPSCNPAIA